MSEFDAVISQPTEPVAAAVVASRGERKIDYTPLLPLHLVVMADAKLDVVYYLLRQYPDALREDLWKKHVA